MIRELMRWLFAPGDHPAYRRHASDAAVDERALETDRIPNERDRRRDAAAPFIYGGGGGFDGGGFDGGGGGADGGCG